MRLPKVEVLMIFIFFGCVAIWAVTKCNSRRAVSSSRTRVSEEEDRPARRDTVYMTPGSAAAAQQPAPTPKPTQPVSIKGPEKASNPTQPVAGTPSATSSASNILYCTVEGLNVRSEPNVRGATVATLKKHEPVSFLNKKTDFTEELNLGSGKVTDHWVKVKTKDGKIGWVFGAGVHYYKK